LTKSIKNGKQIDIYPFWAHFNEQFRIAAENKKIKGKLDNQDKNMEIVFQYHDELSRRIPPLPETKPKKKNWL
jgi:hypothetical protein